MNKHIYRTLYFGLWMFVFMGILFPYIDTKVFAIDWLQLPYWLASGVLWSVIVHFLEKRKENKKAPL